MQSEARLLSFIIISEEGDLPIVGGPKDIGTPIENSMIPYPCAIFFIPTISNVTRESKPMNEPSKNPYSTTYATNTK